MQPSQQVPVNIVGSSIFGRYPKISAEKTYNMFISDNWLVNFAGWQKVLDFFPQFYGAVGRGAFSSIRNEILVVVVNSGVFVLNTALDVTFVGNLSSSSGPVFMDENLNNQIAIVDGINIYIYNYAFGSLTTQTLTTALIPNYVVYHNTYFLFGNGDTKGSGSAWYGYSFDTDITIKYSFQLALQTKPDYAVAVQRLPGGGNSVLVFGTAVTEIWTNVPTTYNPNGQQAPYQRNSSKNIDYGCASVSTIAAADKYVIWLGINESNSPVITMFSIDGMSQSISTDGIDYVLGNINFPAQSTAFFYRDEGHLFYQLTFYNPEDNLTLVYDMDTKKFFNLSDANLDHHPARKNVFFDNNVYFISLNNSGLYQSSTNFTTYNENLTSNKESQDYNYDLDKEIPRIRITSSTRIDSAKPFLSKNLCVTLDQGNDPNVTGLSLMNASNSNSLPYCPRVDLTISKDGGVTFSNTVGINLNPLGYRKNVLRWHRPFGYANDLIFKFRFWGTSYWCVYNGSLEVY